MAQMPLGEQVRKGAKEESLRKKERRKGEQREVAGERVSLHKRKRKKKEEKETKGEKTEGKGRVVGQRPCIIICP